MKNNDIVGMSDVQLRETLGEEQLAYTKLRLANAVSAIENPMKLKEARKTIARLKTEIKARKIKAQQSA